MSALKNTDPVYTSKYTYEEYRLVPENGVKLELIDGEIRAMASPTFRHQEIVTILSQKFRNFLGKGSKCRVATDVDTRLNFDKGDDTAVRPDFLAVCDPSKLKDDTVKGAPDLVVEIWSPSNTHKDRMDKFKKYCDAGVREIWFINPEAGILEAYRLDDATGKHIPFIYSKDDTIPVGIFSGLSIAGEDIFFNAEEEL